VLAKKLAVASFVSLAALTLGLGGCAGQVEDDDDHEVTDLESSSEALTPDPSGGGDQVDQTNDGDGDKAGDPSERGDKECDHRDGDHRKHRNHRHHKFKVLDRLDGTHDNAITIASLPADLPDRLMAKLAKIDKDHDGIVTKAEAKAWMHHKRKHGGRHH
jgi:hypothetical protein